MESTFCTKSTKPNETAVFPNVETNEDMDGRKTGIGGTTESRLSQTNTG